jgi:ribose transport system ATP-binding protein
MPLPDTSLLEMHGIAKRYPGVVALDRVDFEVRRGEVHILLGENGAGKSTLMKILAGAVPRDEGTITINGETVDLGTPRAAQNAGISIIYQDFNLVPFMTVAENIFLGREPTGSLPGFIDRSAMIEQAGLQLCALGVEISPCDLVADLGVAEQQMVEVAKALSVDAKILVMDEPTSALTEKEITRLFTVIRALRAKGVAVIYISHRMEELFQIGDRVTVMRDGRQVGTREIAAVTMDDLVRLMVGRALTEHFPARQSHLGAEVLRVQGLRRDGVLHDISFALRRGEVVGLAGLMGSGRTELARAIFGADSIDGGQIWVNGREVAISSPREAIRLGLGFLTEDRKRQRLALGRDIEENSSLASLDRFTRAGVFSPRKAADKARQLTDDLHVKSPGLFQRVINLSGGNQQKVVLAKWLCREADILIFDEPTRARRAPSAFSSCFASG